MKPIRLENIQNNAIAVVRYIPAYNEYNVKLYWNGQVNKAATYYTDDKSDAIETAQVMILH